MTSDAHAESHATDPRVDDERSMRELLRSCFGARACRGARRGRRLAVAQMEREPVDVLICDIKMPGMSGVDVLAGAKRLDPDVVGIMVTRMRPPKPREALRLGAYDYLAKPFDVES